MSLEREFSFTKASPFVKTSGDKQNSKKKNINILFVGRLVEEKGVLDLYRTYKDVKSQMLNVKAKLKLKIVGHGELKPTLLRMIKDDGFENSVSIEQKSYEEMPEVYREADIFVLPSKKTMCFGLLA